MATLSVPAILIPEPNQSFYSAYGSGTGVELDADGEKVAAVFQAPKAGNIRTVYFRTGTVTTGDTLKITLQHLDANGDPDLGEHGAKTQVVADANDNVTFTVTLSADLAVTQGQLLAVVIEPNGGGSPHMDISINVTGKELTGLPYQDVYNTGAWVHTAAQLCLGIAYDDGSFAYMPGCFPSNGCSTTNLDQDVDPHEYGNWFHVPIACRAIGAWFVHPGTAGATFEVKLYNAAGALATLTPAIGSFVANQICRMLFTSAVDLAADTDYYVTLHSTASTAFAFRQQDVITAASMGQINWGTECYSVEKSNAGVYTATTTRRFSCGVIVDQMTTAAAGGRASFKEANL